MLVAVLFFFILVGLFIFSIFYSGLYEQATEEAEKETLSSLTYLSSTPEFSCINKPNCVDSDKLVSLIDNKNYDKFWSFSSLSVIKSRGFDKSESELIDCDEENYPECDRFIVFDKKVVNEKQISTFVALCRAESELGRPYEKCELAEIIAGTEQLIQGEDR